MSAVAGREDAIAVIGLSGRLDRDPGALDPFALDGTRTTVVAGSREAVAAFERRCAERAITCKRLDVEHAVHTEAMRPIASALTDVVARLPRAAPRLPYLCNVTGDLLSADEATRPSYWAEHLCGAVALAPAIDRLLHDPARVIVEIGPGAGLASLARLAAKRLGGPPRPIVTSLPEGRGEDLRHLLGAVAELWIAGVNIDWRGLWPDGSPGRVPLPTYPFERSRHWIDGPTSPREPLALDPTASPALGRVLAALTPPPAAPEGAAPESDLERRIAAIWSEVLDLPAPPVDRGFFDLGGHSLLAVRAHRLLERDLARAIPLIDLFAHPTIRALARHLDGDAPPPALHHPDGEDRKAALLRQRLRRRGGGA